MNLEVDTSQLMNLEVDTSQLNLEFTFVTSHEKMDIMISSPERHIIEKVGDEIFNNRQFSDEISMKKFQCELNKIMYNRSLGEPKVMMKPNRKNT